jgi:hypothetical protein
MQGLVSLAEVLLADAYADPNAGFRLKANPE